MSLLQTVDHLIKVKGVTDFILQSVTSSGLIDANFPSKGSTSTKVPYPLLSFPAAYTQRQITFGLVKKGDIKLYVDPLGVDGVRLAVVPKPDDLVTHPILGTLRVKDVIDYNEAGLAVLYILQVRK